MTASDARALDAAYVWLRTVEHRLQLVEEQQTHTLPVEPAALTRLARVLGFRDTPGESAVEAFEARHRAQQAVVRAIHEKLFFAPLLDTLAGAGPLTPAAAEERLTAFGFQDIERTREALRELTAGLTRRFARDATAPPGAARLAVDDPRPRPRVVAAATPHRGLHALVGRGSNLPRNARGRGAHEPHPRFEPRARSRDASPTGLPRRARRRRTRSRPSPRAPRSSKTRSARSIGARTNAPVATASGGSSAASSFVSAPATSSVSPTSRPWVMSCQISPTPPSRPRCSRSSRSCRSR